MDSTYTMVRKIKVVDVGETPNNTIEQVQTPETMQVDELPEPAASSLAGMQPVAPIEPLIMKKTRAPRQPRVKKEVIQPIEEDPEEEPQLIAELSLPIINEDIQEESKPKDIKTIELVPCPKCGKKLTERTLKYSHYAVCTTDLHKPIKKTKKEKFNEEQEQINVDTYIEPQTTQRAKRFQVRSERYKGLIVNAF